MNKTFIGVISAALLCAIILSAGCVTDTGGKNTSLTGNWKLADNPAVTIAFGADGTFSGRRRSTSTTEPT